MGFWEGERCEYCGGLIIEKTVDVSRKFKGKHVLVENVSAGVCTECGTRHYAANVLKDHRGGHSWTPKGRARGSCACILAVTLN